MEVELLGELQLVVKLEMRFNLVVFVVVQSCRVFVSRETKEFRVELSGSSTASDKVSPLQ